MIGWSGCSYLFADSIVNVHPLSAMLLEQFLRVNACIYQLLD